MIRSNKTWAAGVIVGAFAVFMAMAFISTPNAVIASHHGNALSANQTDITLDQAQVIVAAAIAESKKLNLKMDICVVDAGANLKAFARMDGAWLGSIDIAIKKARTSRFFDFETGVIGGLSQPGGPLYNIEHSNGGLITFPGGVPIKNASGVVIGAIGVSGSSVENDHAVAKAGVGALAVHNHKH